MTLSQFHHLMVNEFGSAYSQTLFQDYALHEFGDLTSRQALEVGICPKAVWAALCQELDVSEVVSSIDR